MIFLGTLQTGTGYKVKGTLQTGTGYKVKLMATINTGSAGEKVSNYSSNIAR